MVPELIALWKQGCADRYLTDWLTGPLARSRRKCWRSWATALSKGSTDR